MRRILFLILLLLLAGSAWAQDPPNSVRRLPPETQAATQPAPTASCLDSTSPQGLDLRGVRAYRVGVEAAGGGVLLPNFILRAWHWDFVAGKWARGPMSDLAYPEGGTGPIWSPDLAVLVRSGCVYYAAENAGSALTVRFTAWTGAQ